MLYTVNIWFVKNILLRKLTYLGSDRYAEIPDGEDAMRVTVKTLKLLER